MTVQVRTDLGPPPIATTKLHYSGMSKRIARLSTHLQTDLTKTEILALRTKHFCKAQSVSYANSDPLLIVGGRGAFLHDERGNAYLDTRNNVCHVGHQHPAVVRAVQEQIATLNTNTRYLHPNVVRLADALLRTFPAGSALSPERGGKVFFVNSGTEANDLAIRLAQVHTKRTECVVVDHAYHGHSAAVIEISPYKFNGPGGSGKPPHVHVVPCPDVYRGAHRGAGAARAYSDPVGAACTAAASAGRSGVAAFFIESGMSVGGVILPPRGYLPQCYAHVRGAGGVCVADEVQVGFGRYGAHYWGFEQALAGGTDELGEQLVPDIVTMGKPFGNGMALAAVVTTAAIAASFANGMEYFNTFGGNPVACAAGLAVLATIEAEGLREHAVRVGAHLQTRLAELQERAPLIGDVRGSGLFIGIEFVRDRVTRNVAPAEVSLICSRLKEEHRILTSTDGPHHNVLVLKPPMCFSTENADTFVDALDEVLRTLDMSAVDVDAPLTPT